MGKLALILRSDDQFQCILVTEEGDVIDGKRQAIHHKNVYFDVIADGIICRHYDDSDSSLQDSHFSLQLSLYD